MAGGVVHVPRRLPLLVVSDAVLLPGASLRVPIRSTKGMNLVRSRLLNRNSLTSAMVGVVTREPGDEQKEGMEGLHRIGTAAMVVQVHATNWPQPNFSLLLTGLCRFHIDELLQESPYLVAKVTQLDHLASDTESDNSAARSKELAEAIQNFSEHLGKLVEAMDGSGLPVTFNLKKMLTALPSDKLADVCASIMRSSLAEKLQVLDAVDLRERFEKVLPLVLRQLEGLKHVTSSSGRTIRGETRKGEKETLYESDRESEDDGNEDDVSTLLSKIKTAKMPKDAEKIALKELKRLKSMTAAAPEHATLRTYLELMVDLPWSKRTNDVLDLDKARKQLDADHYGLAKTKARILEYLAVRQLKNSLKGPILCLVGPPGVGKTSIGKSIALTLGRQFHRISLGGVSDQSDIRGHRRTYIGSMPGRIIQGLRQACVNNPVFLLDEIDKMTRGVHGDPAAALLEVLDPEQNHTFTDHYLNMPFDISQVLFVATANSLTTIPAALLDRMEVIKISGYTHEDKVEIAMRHLLKKQYSAHGLCGENHIRIPEATLKVLVCKYTREAGVRSLERKIGAICRAVAVKVAGALRGGGAGSQAAIAASADEKSLASGFLPMLPIVIDEAAAQDILGPHPYDDGDVAERLCEPGVAAGLAWTPYGGEVMFVEATRMDGDGKLVLTGQLGDVMKESASLALNWLRSHSRELQLERRLMDATDVHIHFPAGAVEKDGPSAGAAVATALVSLFSDKAVRPDTAMTGEITLRGLVLPVGGVKEKILAAHRAGFNRVILPQKNEKDLGEVPTAVKNDMQFILVRSLTDVLRSAFEDGYATGLGGRSGTLISKL